MILKDRLVDTMNRVRPYTPIATLATAFVLDLVALGHAIGDTSYREPLPRLTGRTPGVIVMPAIQQGKNHAVNCHTNAKIQALVGTTALAEAVNC